MKDNYENEIRENLIENKMNKEKSEDNLKQELKDEGDNLKQRKDKETNLGVNDKNKIIENNQINELNTTFGEIIEDNIQLEDTIQLIVNLKKKSYLDYSDYIKNDDDYIKLKGKERTKFNIHSKINKKFLRYSTLVIIILYIIITITSSILFHIRREKYPFLFCFKFIERDPNVSQDQKEKDIIYFLIDLNSFYILHFVILLIFISICIFLIKASQSEIDYFFDYMSIFLPITLIFNILIFLNGMFTVYFYGSHLQSIIYLVLTLIGFLCMVKIYLVTKGHKYKNVSSYINISVLISLMTAYQTYCFLFNVNYFIMNFYKPQVKQDNEYPGIEIALSCIYFVVGIVIITVYKDIFFNVAMVNIQIGLLYSKRESEYSLTTSIVNIAILSLNYASIILVIFAYHKKVFQLKKKKG
jgi:hypothetical protein